MREICLQEGYIYVLLGIYAASKAALTIITETLRLELSPLGVNVISVETGGVKSNGHGNLPPVRLPPGSNYLPLEKLMAARARGDDNFTRMETKTYAEKVVKDVLRGRRGRIWRGKAAGMIRWSNLLPVWVMVSSCFFFFSRFFPPAPQVSTVFFRSFYYLNRLFVFLRGDGLANLRSVILPKGWYNEKRHRIGYVVVSRNC